MFENTKSAARFFGRGYVWLAKVAIGPFRGLYELSKIAPSTLLLQIPLWLIGGAISLCLTVGLSLPLAIIGAIVTTAAAILTFFVTGIMDIFSPCFSSGKAPQEHNDEQTIPLVNDDTIDHTPGHVTAIYKQVNPEATTIDMPIEQDSHEVLYDKKQAELAAQWFLRVLENEIPDMYQLMKITDEKVQLNLNDFKRTIFVERLTNNIWKKLQSDPQLNIRHIGSDFSYRLEWNDVLISDALSAARIDIGPVHDLIQNTRWLNIHAFISQSGKTTYQLGRDLGNCADYLQGKSATVHLPDSDSDLRFGYHQ